MVETFDGAPGRPSWIYHPDPRWNGTTGTAATRRPTCSGRRNRTASSWAAVEGMSPGRAFDVGAGEGRNAVWLAERRGRSRPSTFPTSEWARVGAWPRPQASTSVGPGRRARVRAGAGGLRPGCRPLPAPARRGAPDRAPGGPSHPCAKGARCSWSATIAPRSPTATAVPRTRPAVLARGRGGRHGRHG